LSGAYKTSEEIKGQADAKATLIYANAYRQDAEFFGFWRALESYKQVLPQFNKTLSTHMDYFKYLYNPGGQP
jgi:membrane protease subunit HflC